ncbi:MAG: DNA translocase FtsK, partial [Candidatus Zixiibacteriota bacterium]
PSLGGETGALGGWVTEQLTSIVLRLVGETGSYVILSGLAVILLLLYTSITPVLHVRIKLPGMTTLKKIAMPLVAVAGLFGRIGEWIFGRGDETATEDEPAQELEPSSTTSTVLRDDGYQEAVTTQREVAAGTSDEPKPARQTKKTVAETFQAADYVYPELDLLDEPAVSGPSVTAEELDFGARLLRETLETFGVRVDGPIQKFPGPVITRFEFKPAAGIKVNQIVGLSDDLALAMKARRIRIVAPIPGKAAVGVEIPNRSPQIVHLRDILASEAFRDGSLLLPLALGKSIAGQPVVADLAKMPHLLIAGATGAGKSVCMNVLITSLIYRLHPWQVRFIFIDPKMLELSVYSGLPHMGRPVVTKAKRAEKVLADAVVEMERRYRQLAEAGVRNIEDFNRKQTDPEARLPYIVIMVDELADLMISTTGSKTEMLITRLAQMARAVGIHLILATQRPSVDVLTGLIKANFPARIAFQVATRVDSRTILDGNGAEKLLGNGDMLFLPPGQPEPIRIHGAYISSAETERLVQFIKKQEIPARPLSTISQATGEVDEREIDLGDPLFKEACEVVIRHKQGSVSLLQRRLGIGYQRAARLIDKLEQAGIVSPFDGSKARDVLVDKAYIDAMFGGKPQEVARNSE